MNAGFCKKLSIPHAQLLAVVAERVVDGAILHIIKLWLKAPVIAEDNDGTRKNVGGGKSCSKGTPQGGVISPLLSNCYLHLLDRIWEKHQLRWKLKARIVRYADDFVLMGKDMPEAVIGRLKELLERMGLSLNEEKTRIVDMKKDFKGFHFLGFEFRYNKGMYDTLSTYLHIGPSPKSDKKVREKIHEYLRHSGHRPPPVIVKDMNAIIRGWIHYITIPAVSYPAKSKRDLRYYLADSMTRFYQRKSQRPCKWAKEGAFEILTKSWGLIDPTKYALPVKLR